MLMKQDGTILLEHSTTYVAIKTLFLEYMYLALGPFEHAENHSVHVAPHQNESNINVAK